MSINRKIEEEYIGMKLDLPRQVLTAKRRYWYGLCRWTFCRCSCHNWYDRLTLTYHRSGLFRYKPVGQKHDKQGPVLALLPS